MSEFLSLTGTTVGVDEVGRGALVGSVVVAAVILPMDCQLPLRDSKKLSQSKRESFATLIKEQAIAYAVGVATEEEIDVLNILQATMLAMQRAVNQLVKKGVEISIVYVDGNYCPKILQTCQSVIKGDDKVMEISAASIIAKVHRDQQMIKLDKQYPKYGFKKHKGYPTPKHLQALEKLGLIPCYRKSFKPIKK